MVTDPSEHSRKEVLFRPRDVTLEFQKSDEGYQLSKLKREREKKNKQEKKNYQNNREGWDEIWWNTETEVETHGINV